MTMQYLRLIDTDVQDAYCEQFDPRGCRHGVWRKAGLPELRPGAWSVPTAGGRLGPGCVGPVIRVEPSRA